MLNSRIMGRDTLLHLAGHGSTPGSLLTFGSVPICSIIATLACVYELGEIVVKGMIGDASKRPRLLIPISLPVSTMLQTKETIFASSSNDS